MLVMCLFMPPQLQVLAAIGACVYFVVRTVRAKMLPIRANYWWALLLGGGYLFYIFALPLTPIGHRHYLRSLCEQKVAYLLLPFVFAITAQVFRQLIIGQLMYFVYGAIIACTLANVDYLYHHFIVGGVSGELSHVAYRNIFEFFTGIHPTYMAMYLCFALFVVFFQFTAETKRQTLLKYSIIYVLLLFMLAVFAKAPLIALALIGLHYMVVNRHILYRFKWAFVSLVAIVTGAYFFIPFFRQRAGEMLGFFHSDPNANVIQNSVNMRKLLFNTDKSMLQHYWLTGTGPGRMLDLLHKRYFFQSLYRGYWVGYFDPHNQYFYDWLSFGIAGILMLVIVLLVHLRKAVLSRSPIYLYFLVVIVVTLFTESLLARQQGLLFYSIFTSLFFFASVHKRSAANSG